MAAHERNKAKKDDELRRSNKARESGPHKVKACNETPKSNTLDTTSMESHVALLGEARLSHAVSTGQNAQLLRGLQRSHGNAYVQRLLESRTVQAKLTINPPDDQYEREADRVAATITQAPEPRIQGQPKSEEEDEKVQMKASSCKDREVSEDLERRINASRGLGQPLLESARASLETRLQRDLSHVRIHTDAEADELAQELQARAFTRGQDIFFGQGMYQPASEAGIGLIAHETAHVIQQGGASIFRQEVKKTTIEPFITKAVAATKGGLSGGHEALDVVECMIEVLNMVAKITGNPFFAAGVLLEPIIGLAHMALAVSERQSGLTSSGFKLGMQAISSWTVDNEKNPPKILFDEAILLGLIQQYYSKEWNKHMMYGGRKEPNEAALMNGVAKAAALANTVMGKFEADLQAQVGKESDLKKLGADFIGRARHAAVQQLVKELGKRGFFEKEGKLRH